MPDIEFTTVDLKTWETLPVPQPHRKPDLYVKVLDALESGAIVQLPVNDDNDMKGRRISIGRKARARGFIVQFRSENNTLYARKSDEQIKPKEPRETKAK